MLDGAIKTIMVDDSKTVGELLVTICSRIGVELILTAFDTVGSVLPLATTRRSMKVFDMSQF